MNRYSSIEMLRCTAGILMAILLCLLFPAVVYAQADDSGSAAEYGAAHVYDGVGLLSSSETEELEQRCLELETQTGIHMLMVTTADTQGKSQREYADDFYDDRYPEEKDEDGVVILIDMGDREMYVSTAGILRYCLSDREIDRLLDDMYDEVSAQNYAGAFEQAADHVERAVRQGISGGDFLIDEDGSIIRYRRITVFEVFVAAVAGFGVFCLVFFGVRHSYQKKVKSDMRGYGRVSSMKLDREQDTLIDRHVTARKIVHNPPPGSGGGSSVHTSSSGRSHGGGGRSF